MRENSKFWHPKRSKFEAISNDSREVIKFNLADLKMAKKNIT